MGWWSSPDNPDVQIGDGPLDAAADFLRVVAARYREELGRNPSVEEVEAVLASALRAWADARTLQNFDEREVAAVTIKTAKRKKRLKYQLGDVFAIPLSDGRYAFGRIYNLDPNWNLIEVFAHVARSPHYTPDAEKSGRLLQPITIAPKDVFETGLWPIVHSDPGFRPADLDSLRYVMGLPGMYKLMKVNQLKPLGPISNAEAAKHPQWKFKPLPGTLADIERALKERKLI
jgi:hypothetical protein